MATFGEALDYARRLLAAGNLVQAEVIYRRLVEAAPHAAEPWHELGILQMRADRPEAGIESLRQAIAINPHVPTYHGHLSAAYLILKQPAEAIACLEHALKLAPPTAELLNTLALSLSGTGQTDAALRAFDDALRICPQYATIHINRGNLLAEAQRLEEAAASYQRAIDLQPENPLANSALGLVYYKMSRSISLQFIAADADKTHDAVLAKQAHLTRAVACLRRALELKPDYVDAERTLTIALSEQCTLPEATDGCWQAISLLAQGQPGEAAACLQRILAMKPDFVEAHYRLGVVRAEQRQTDAAIACYRQAIAFDPRHAEAYNHLAAALLERNRAAEAVACLRQVLLQKPDFVAARKNLELATTHLNQLGEPTAGKQRAPRFLNLQAAERNVYSQNGEDGVIEALFAELGTANKFFVEFGCNDGRECNGAYLLEQGWTGLQMDGQKQPANPRRTIHQEFITAENVNDVFRKHDVPAEFDLLSIDIDGNDFWVWQQITARPRVVVIEYNSSIPPNQRLSIAYDPAFVWNGSDYSGASLLALKELGQRKGYTLVYCERAGVNAFFVANESLPDGFEPLNIEEIYRLPNYAYWGVRHRPETTRKMIDPFAGSR